VIRNIIFDWSGTLVNDLPAVWNATNYVFEQAGVNTMDLEQFRKEFFLPFEDFYDIHTPGVSIEQLDKWYHEHFQKVIHSVEELPYARDFLKFCRNQEILTFLLSTIHPEHFRIQSEANRFHEYLDHPYVRILNKKEKILELIDHHELNPRETLFIGDMVHDIETARQGKVHSCAVLTGYNQRAQLQEAEPDLIVEHLWELQKILQKYELDLIQSWTK